MQEQRKPPSLPEESEIIGEEIQAFLKDISQPVEIPEYELVPDKVQPPLPPEYEFDPKNPALSQKYREVTIPDPKNPKKTITRHLRPFKDFLANWKQHHYRPKEIQTTDFDETKTTWRIPRYIYESDPVKTLGKGGLSIIYRGVDQKMNRFVALKVLRPGFNKIPENQDLIELEAKAQVRFVEHPNIVEVYDFFYHDGLPFMVMEDMSAQNALTLKEILHGYTDAEGIEHPGRELSIDEMVSISQQIAQATDYMEQRGFRNRDLKPSNIFLTPDGQVKICDFGLGTGVTKPREGIGFGTPHYESPERAQGFDLSYQDEVYTICANIYEILTETYCPSCWQGDSTMEMLVKKMTVPYPPDHLSNSKSHEGGEKLIQRLGEKTVHQLDKVFQKGFANDPSERPQTATEFANDFVLALRGELPDDYGSSKVKTPEE